jgi:hypothetical protein
MQVSISGLSQEFSFEDGSTINAMLITLPDGVQVRAVINDEATEHITRLYVKLGGAVLDNGAEVAPAQQAPRMATSNQPVGRNFSPLELTDGEEDSAFGGDYAAEGLAAVGQQLKQAEQTIATAVGDTSTLDGAELRRIAGQLRQGVVSPLPQPSWDGPQAAQPSRPALTVSRDEMGNPVLRGAGLVDPHDLTGGSNAEEGDVGQI